MKVPSPCLWLFAWLAYIYLYFRIWSWARWIHLFDYYRIPCNSRKSMELLLVLCSYTEKHNKWSHNPSSFSIFHSPSVIRRESAVRRHQTIVSFILSRVQESPNFFYYHEMKFHVENNLSYTCLWQRQLSVTKVLFSFLSEFHLKNSTPGLFISRDVILDYVNLWINKSTSLNLKSCKLFIFCILL